MTSQVRLGIVGSGYIAGVVSREMRGLENITVAGVTSRRRANAEAFASAHGVPQVFDSWQELVASDAIDAVYVATPTDVRAEIAIAAAGQKKHVMGDKPFLNLSSLRTITDACRANGVVFMDATHFSHHPRTLQVRRELHERIGQLRTIQSAFCFPNNDRSNIRFDMQREPTGAFGDMAWYSMRAIVEYTPDDAELAHSSGYMERDAVTGSVISTHGSLVLSNGVTSTWTAGFNVGSLVMDLSLLGAEGKIAIDDYVLDWETTPALPTPGYPVGFTHYRGVVNPQGAERVLTPAPVTQAAQMMSDFAALCAAPHGPALDASIRVSERTQALLDGVWPTLQEIPG